MRFVVVDTGGRACPPWRVWVNSGQSDVYFAHRELAGEMKGSLHASGSWQYGLTEQRAKTGKPIPGWTGDSRHMKVWKRPPELFPGLTRAVSIFVPTSELQVLPETTDRSRCIEIPAAPAGQGVEVTLFFAKPLAHVGGRWPGEHDANTKLLAEWDLPSGEHFFVVHREVEVPLVTLTDISEHRQRFAHLQDTPTARARLGILGFNPADGSAFITEGAINPDPIDSPLRPAGGAG